MFTKTRYCCVTSLLYCVRKYHLAQAPLPKHLITCISACTTPLICRGSSPLWHKTRMWRA
jgi:hypothetical protein